MSVAGILDEKTDSGRLEFHARRLDPFRIGEGVECPIDKLRNRHPEWFREGFLALLELLRRGEIQPVVAERLPLTEAGGAHELLESSAAMGKLCSCHRPSRDAR